MKITESFNVNLVNSESNIVIFGGGVYGEIAYWGLKSLNLEPAYFCDRRLSGKTNYDIPVINLDELPNIKNSLILIASVNYFFEMKNELDERGINNYYDIETLHWLPIDHKKLSKQALEKLNNVEIYQNAISYNPLGKAINITRIEIVTSERCTLKCRDCATLMQYYKEPKHIDLVKYKNAFDKLLSLVEHISELRILGGEPLINKDMYKIIDWYANNDKIGRITVFTNGTIIPNDMTVKSLKNYKVSVHISDYDVKNGKIKELEKLFLHENVKFYVRKYDTWNQFGDLSKRNYTEDELHTIFKNCITAQCLTFLEGKLFRCPRSAHGMKLGAINVIKDDYIDFEDVSADIDELRQKVTDLTRNKNYLDACRYCDGFMNKANEISPAIQTKKTLPYQLINPEKFKTK